MSPILNPEEIIRSREFHTDTAKSEIMNGK